VLVLKPGEAMKCSGRRSTQRRPLRLHQAAASSSAAITL
jgi:hypothetical protein